MKKQIVGLIGSKKDNNTVASILEKHGFYRVSVTSKVKEIGSFLLTKSDIEKDIVVDKFREKAYSINKLYWINLLLSSIPVKYDKIVIDDLYENDIFSEKMIVIRVNKENMENVSEEIKKIIK